MTNILLLEPWRLFYRGKVTLPAIPVNKEHCQLFQFYKDQVSNHCSHPKLHHGVPWGELSSESHSVMSDSLRPRGLYSPWNSLGQNTGMGCLSLLQGIFPTQGLNQGLRRCRRVLHKLNHGGSPSGARGKEKKPACRCKRQKRRRFDPWVGKIPLEKNMTTHSSILAWKIPWTEEPGGLQYPCLENPMDGGGA